MAQNTTVMAFRKRLKKRGYEEISIKSYKGEENKVISEILFMVTAIEPLSGNRVCRLCGYEFMNDSFR